MRYSLHRTVQRRTYGLIYRLFQNKNFSRKWSKRSYIEIFFKTFAVLFFFWYFILFYYRFFHIHEFDYRINDNPKVCSRARYLQTFKNVTSQKLEEQIRFYQLLLSHAEEESKVFSKLLPVTQAMIKSRTPICPIFSPKLVGFLTVNSITATLDSDLVQLKRKLQDLRVAATKFLVENANQFTTANSTSNALELPHLKPRLKQVSFVYPLNESAVPLPLYLEQPPPGVVPPGTCFPFRRTAIIIPYRNRENHLKLFIRHMHDVMQRQQIEYGIYVINLATDVQFNRAKLLNIGYKEALYHYSRYDCIIFHDVDLLPEDDRNLYTCSEEPKHMSVAINIFQYRLPYREIFGGVTALTPYQFELVNGYSNEYWGWGGEDDDMFQRLSENCMRVYRISSDIAKYRMEKHRKDKGNEPHFERFNLLHGARNRFKIDGLSSLKYTVLKRDYQLLYNNITVEIGVPDYYRKTREEIIQHYAVVFLCFFLIFVLISTHEKFR